MKLVNIGFGNMVSANRMVAIVSPESAPIKRIIQEAKEKGIDLQNALKTHGTSEPLWRLDSGVWATANVSALDLRIIYIGGKTDE